MAVKILRARRHLIHFHISTKIMGILNVTPDSFSGDGIFTSSHYIEKAVKKAKEMVKEGADIIDVGGESTRPGSRPIPVKEEMQRVIPVIRILAKTLKKPISIDSYKADVICEALKAGASIVNDIMGTPPNKKILQLVAKTKAAIVLMHIRGTPKTMQKHIYYDDVVTEIIGSLRKSIEKCLESGIKPDRIIIDPGIGFGKTSAHNLEIIKHLRDFTQLGFPILIGPSRKSFIGKVLRKDKKDRLFGTAASIAISVWEGANIIRVHDVAAMRDVVKMVDAMRYPKRWNHL